MKKLLSSLIVVGMLFLASYSSPAPVFSTNCTAGSFSLLTFPGQIKQIVVANATTNVATWALVDAPSTSFTYTNAAYTNIVFGYLTNQVLTYTNYFGATNTTTNVYAFYQTNSVSAATNNYGTIVTEATPGGTTATLTFAVTQPFNFGILITNNQAVSVTIQYNHAISGN